MKWLHPTSKWSNTVGGFSLLEVYKKLRNLSATISDDCSQNTHLDEAKKIILDVCNEHVYAVQSFIKNPQIQTTVSKEIEDDCQELIDYVIAAKRFNLEVNARSKDRVVSFGEKLSCRFMTAMLRDRVCQVNPKLKDVQLTPRAECRCRIR